MPSTRRRFLAGVTALSAALAGCNEGTSGAVEETVTPVAVPRTDGEVLSELADVETLEIRTTVIVTEAHLDAAIGHVERLRNSVEERRQILEDADDERVRLHRPPDETLRRARDRISEAREEGPSGDALSTLRGAVRELARVDGLARVVAGDVDADSLRSSIGSEREATTAVQDGVDYRIAGPVAEHLPTAAAAERRLENLDELDRAERMLEEAVADARRDDAGHPTGTESGTGAGGTDGEVSRPTDRDGPHPDVLASVYERLEIHRRSRDDAERYFETATDPDAPSLLSPIAAELDGLESELAAIAERAPEDVDRRNGEESSTERLRGIRSNVAQRTAEFHSGFSERREDGRRLYALFEAVRRVIEFRAIDVAVERTIPLARQREFPTERLPEEKRSGVEVLERLADGSTLQRHFGQRAAGLIRSTDRYAEGEAVDERRLAQCHLLLVAGAEWAERALERGEGLSESLQAQQS